MTERLGAAEAGAAEAGTELREQFRESVREVLARASAVRGPHPVWAAERTDADAAKQAAALGWTGLLIEERWGGAGAGMLEAVIVAEELGAHLTPMPFLSSAVLAATALSAGGSQAQRQRWLPALAAGQLRGAAALTGPSGRVDTGLGGDGGNGGGVRATRDGDGARLDGTSGFVLDGAGADLLLVAAGGPGGPELYALDRARAGVEITELLAVDRTRRLATVVLSDVRADASARLPRAAEAITAMLQRGSVALAADSAGAARRALDMAVSYAKQRQQFGRPIGAFQAVKHKLADMYLLVQGAALAVAGAAEALDSGQDAERLVTVAASYARDAAAKVTGDAIQVHGGIGYTWEHDCHRLFKRAKLNEAFLGDPAAHRDRLAALLLGR
jgi:alkylation response protein AidB-like acyl-CoA dehydrogenase